MTRRGWTVAIVAVALAAGGVQWSSASRVERLRADRDAARIAASQESARRALDITFYEQRVARDPQGAADRAQLGALYLQRAREGNDFQDYLRADSVARASLSLRTSRNSSALAVLVSSLLAQHRFAEAQRVARQLADADPAVHPYRALLGETCMETGDYACAQRAFESIPVAARQSLAVAPRLARWAEIRGDTAGARTMFRAIMSSVATSSEMPLEQRAWFHLRAADLEMRQGRPQRAAGLLQRGLDINPLDHRLLASVAQLAASQQQWDRAIQFGDSAIAVALDPATLGVISDAYAAKGDSARATEYFAAMEASVGQQPGAYHRAWSLFLLDHDQRVGDVLAAAQREIENRRDVYGYDLLAWALYKSARFAEARAAMQAAMAQGTHDPLLLRHARAIEQAFTIASR